MTFDLSRYLQRIGLDAVPSGLGGLATLQAAHMRAIPFEAIDPLLGIVPDLDPGAIWAKLVLGGRGGYCLEQNALLGAALEALGHVARPILGRVRMGAQQGGPRAHHAWIVSLPEGAHLVDAGFGGPGPAGPVRLDADAQLVGGERFRLRADPATAETVLETLMPEGWFALYGFDDAAVTAADLAAANFVCARWSMAPFAGNLMLNRLTEDGRVSLFNREGRTVRNRAVAHWTLASAEDLAQRLAKDFALPAAAPFADAVWSRIAGTEARTA
jgi:N-hydroxyarylamine O-acetyltransferase